MNILLDTHMSGDNRPKRVFISCFEEEFRRELRALEQALEEHGYELPKWVSMGGSIEDYLEYYFKHIENSDVLVGIYGAFHGGMVPSGQSPSHTDYSYLEAEFRKADELGKPIIAFIQGVRGRDAELSSPLPQIVKRHRSYWFDTGKDLIVSVLERLDEPFESTREMADESSALAAENVIETKVFLSYAREDAAEARHLFDDLRGAGFDVWFDEKSLIAGQNWETAIKGAIKDSRFFVALLSEHSVSKKGFVQKELKEAINQLDEYSEGEIFLIPVRITDCNPRDERLRQLHRVDMFPDWKDGLSRIIEAIKSQR